MNSGLFQQLLRGDYGVEEAVALDIAADFKLTLRLDDVRRVGGLDEKIYLAASASRISPVAVGRGGKVASGRENAIWQFYAPKWCGAYMQALRATGLEKGCGDGILRFLQEER